MFTSLVFAVLLLAVVAIYYLVPRAERCPGCGARRDDSPLCAACGWVFETVPEEDDDDDYGEPEVIDEEWRA